jgi:hypothetical protein
MERVDIEVDGGEHGHTSIHGGLQKGSGTGDITG